MPDDDLVDAEGKPLEGKARSRTHRRLRQDIVTGYERFQDTMAEAFADLGIERGVNHAEQRRVQRFMDDAAPEPVPKNRTTVEWRSEQAMLTERLRAAAEAAECEWCEAKCVRAAAEKEREEAALAAKRARETESIARQKLAYADS